MSTGQQQPGHHKALPNRYPQLVGLGFANFLDFRGNRVLQFLVRAPRRNMRNPVDQEGSMRSGWLSSWPFTRPLVRSSVFLDVNAECVRDGFGMLVREWVVGAFDSLDGNGGHVRRSSKLRLSQPLHHSPVAWVALVGGYEDDRFDRSAEDGHDASEDVDLGAARPGFPVVDRADRYVGYSGKVTDAEARGCASGREFLRTEAAQDAATHAAVGGIGLIAGQVHRILPKITNKRILS
jgi:hypothetical protein